MLVPSRVKIVANNEGAYYDKFIGTEHDVIDSDGTEITLQIMDDTGKETHTFWYDGEYEVLEWDEKDNKVEIEIETVTIGKAEYDELLEFKKLCDERLVYECMYEDKDLEDI